MEAITNVFILYPPQEGQFAKNLSNDLIPFGITSSLSSEIEAGIRAKYLRSVLEEGRRLVVLVSPSTLETNWIVDAVIEAAKGQMYEQIVVAVLNGARVPQRLAGYSQVHFASPNEYAKNVGELASKITGQKPGDVQPGSSGSARMNVPTSSGVIEALDRESINIQDVLNPPPSHASLLYDVYLLYSAPDHELARRLSVDLTRAGIPAWFDKKEDLSEEKIKSAIDASRIVVPIISAFALKSRLYVSMVEYAIATLPTSNVMQRIIPVLNEDVAVPESLAKYLYVDFRRDYDWGVAYLVAGITSERLPSSATYDAFLAFSYKDIEFVRKLDADLTKQGLAIWFDDRNLKPGDELTPTLFQGVASSRNFILVVSPNSVRSRWVRVLLQQASQQTSGRGLPRLIPIMYQDAQLPNAIADQQFVDFRDPNLYDRAIIIIVDTIRGQVPTPQPTPPVQTTPPPQPTQPIVSPPTPPPPPTKTEVPTRALADTTSEDNDLLRFDDYAQALADFIKNEKTGKPLTIGIDAAWGMGKSTLMRMLQKKLSGAEEAEKKAKAEEQEAKRKAQALVEGKLVDENNEPIGSLELEASSYKPGQLGAPVQSDKKIQKHKPFRGEQGLPNVWFNAWKYSKEESLWAALALEILKQIRKQMNRRQRWGFAFKLTFERLDKSLLIQRALKSVGVVVLFGVLGAVVLFIALAWVGSTINLTFEQILNQYVGTVGIIGVVAAVYSIGKEAYDKVAGVFDLKISQYVREPKYQERIGFLAEFEDDFERMVNVVTEDGRWPLIVFIDDLDRCAPPKPSEIIEAINLLLDAEHCVFVIGMDARTVACGIEAKYKDIKPYLEDGDDPGGLTLGQRFLEKIVQINFRIPKSDKPLIESFIKNNLGATSAQENKPPAEQVQQVKEEIQAEQRAGKTLDDAAQAVQAKAPDIQPAVLIQAKQEVRAMTFDDSPDVQQAIAEASEFLKYNPRKIKQFINLFRLRAFLANRRGMLDSGAINLSVLSRWVVIRVRWPDFIQAAEADPKFIERLQQAIDLRTKMLSETDENKLKPLKTQYDALAKDKRIERLVDATDLVGLMRQIVQSGNMETYLAFV